MHVAFLVLGPLSTTLSFILPLRARSPTSNMINKSTEVYLFPLEVTNWGKLSDPRMIDMLAGRENWAQA